MYALNAQEISYKEHFRDAMRRKVVCMPTLYLYSFKNNSFHFTSILYDFVYILKIIQIWYVMWTLNYIAIYSYTSIEQYSLGWRKLDFTLPLSRFFPFQCKFHNTASPQLHVTVLWQPCQKVGCNLVLATTTLQTHHYVHKPWCPFLHRQKAGRSYLNFQIYKFFWSSALMDS